VEKIKVLFPIKSVIQISYAKNTPAGSAGRVHLKKTSLLGRTFAHLKTGGPTTCASVSKGVALKNTIKTKNNLSNVFK
jgi:hypothetical protein